MLVCSQQMRRSAHDRCGRLFISPRVLAQQPANLNEMRDDLEAGQSQERRKSQERSGVQKNAKWALQTLLGFFTNNFSHESQFKFKVSRVAFRGISSTSADGSIQKFSNQGPLLSGRRHLKCLSCFQTTGVMEIVVEAAAQVVQPLRVRRGCAPPAPKHQTFSQCDLQRKYFPSFQKAPIKRTICP